MWNLIDFFKKIFKYFQISEIPERLKFFFNLIKKEVSDQYIPTMTETPISLPWVEKYRPTSLDEIVSHRTTLKTIKMYIE